MKLRYGTHHNLGPKKSLIPKPVVNSVRDSMIVRRCQLRHNARLLAYGQIVEDMREPKLLIDYAAQRLCCGYLIHKLTITPPLNAHNAGGANGHDYDQATVSE